MKSKNTTSPQAANILNGHKNEIIQQKCNKEEPNEIEPKSKSITLAERATVENCHKNDNDIQALLSQLQRCYQLTNATSKTTDGSARLIDNAPTKNENLSGSTQPTSSHTSAGLRLFILLIPIAFRCLGR
jgi:hypothetical protein